MSIIDTDTGEIIEALSVDEQSELVECEAKIERGLQTFYEVGQALMKIRDSRLYRESHSSFEAYCQERWDFRRARADDLIAASRVFGVLNSSGIQSDELPSIERHIRPLTQLEPEEQEAVWEIVKKTAPGGKVTAAHVQSVVAVAKEVIKTNAIDGGEGIDIPITAATTDHFKAAVTENTYERMKRQEAHIAEKNAIKAQKKANKREKKEAVPAIITRSAYRLLTGDLMEVGKSIDSQSIDWIVTDPPYPREFIPEYERLAQLAQRVLKPGGSLLVMCGQSYLPELMALMTPCLRYHWTLAYLTPGGQSVQLWERNVNTFWKPVLWFVNGDYTGDWIGDVSKSAVNDNDKRFHDWGQSESGMADLVERFTYPGQTILDPFMGAGTTGVVAVRGGRQFIGIDMDAACVAIAEERLCKIVA
jgi:site-specific DNA-methyltransferase (adenine-specific)